MPSHPLPELLAPAGSFDAALAAFTYGADAIYLGLSRFSARADATNFDDEALRKIVAYAHGLERPRKVYVTLNTLLETRERADLLPSLALLREVGVDAVIVQDLGLAAIIHQHFPEIQLHASTQLACTSTAGARALVELGFTRIVTARELTLEEAATIGQKANVEIEVFVHGALCYSISGLCLFSSLTTGRSGNRGRCAYCCRQAFRDGEGKASHPFSMRDLAMINEMKTLLKYPLASLKIEGRMKNPLYVAAVTDLYRTALDGKLTPELLIEKSDNLRTIFSRPWTPLYARTTATPPEKIIDSLCIGHRGTPIGKVQTILRDTDGTRWLGFTTSRALEKHDGLQIDPPAGGRPIGFAVDRMRIFKTYKNLLTIPAGKRIEVALPHDVSDLPKGATIYCSASQAVRRAFPVKQPRATALRQLQPAALSLRLHPQTITLEGCGVSVSQPATLEPAKHPERTFDAAKKALTRLGEEGFYLQSLRVDDPQGLFLPVSMLHALRRTWAEQARLQQADAHLTRQVSEEDLLPANTTNSAKTLPHYTVKLHVHAPLSFIGDDLPEEIIVTLDATSSWDDVKRWWESFPRQLLRFALPPALRDEDLASIADVIGRLSDKGIHKFECADLTGWQLLQDLQPYCEAYDISADWSWYAINPEGVHRQAAMGISFAVTGPEANLPNLISLPIAPKKVVLLTQYAPLFIAYNPPLAQHDTLIDRNGNTLCLTHIGRLWSTYDLRPWSIASYQRQLLEAGFDTYRIDVSWTGAKPPLSHWRPLLAPTQTLPRDFETPRL